MNENSKILVSFRHDDKVICEKTITFINKNTYTFGSLETNDLHINSSLIESRQGSLSIADGKLYIQNHGRFNQIYVNRQPVAASCEIDEDSDIAIFHNGTAIKIRLNFLRESKQQRLLIGRDKSCDIVLHNASVNSHHAEITSDAKGQYYINDLNSAHGTKVLDGKNKAHTIYNKKLLATDDIVIIADYEIIFQNGRWTAEQNSSGHTRLDNLVEVNDLSITFKKSLKKTKPTLNNINVSIKYGEFVGLLGSAGAGKSVLGSCIRNDLKKYSGEIFIEGKKHNKDVKIAYVPQKDTMRGSLTVDNCLYKQADYLYGTTMTSREIKDRITEILNSLNIGDEVIRKNKIGKLSGGQAKRVSVALELLQEPKLFFLDEPTASLDPNNELDMVKILHKFVKKEKKTVVMITHRIRFVDMFDRLIIIGTGGHLCFEGTLDDALLFFNVDELDEDIYKKIGTEDGAKTWAAKFDEYRMKEYGNGQG